MAFVLKSHRKQMWRDRKPLIWHTLVVWSTGAIRLTVDSLCLHLQTLAQKMKGLSLILFSCTFYLQQEMSKVCVGSWSKEVTYQCNWRPWVKMSPWCALLASYVNITQVSDSLNEIKCDKEHGGYFWVCDKWMNTK